MKKFSHIAKLLKEHRINARMSQTDISKKLGYKKNAQMLSNIERGLCSIPASRVRDICQVLNMNIGLAREAMIKDFTQNLDYVIEHSDMFSEVKSRRK